MSDYVHPILQDLPAKAETATKLDQPLAAEVYHYPLGLLDELERLRDLPRLTGQLLANDIWGMGPRTDALLQMVGEEGMLGRFLASRIGQARPAKEPRKRRPRQPEQHKRRIPVPAQGPLINSLQELLPSVGQPGGMAVRSRPV